MNIHLIAVPYDSGIHGWRMGAGPDRLLGAGAAERLRAAGHAVTVERIELPLGPPVPEARVTFAVAARLAERVAAARAADALPLILAGNCATAMGTLAGLSDAEPAIVWMDAHADFNTPETTRTGMVDGMALAIATGRCWSALASTIPGFRAVPESRVCLAGTRDVDAAERESLADTAAAVLPPADLAARLSSTLDALRAQTDTVYLHLDLDVLDPAEGTVNEFAAPDGVRVEQVVAVIVALKERFRIGAIAFTAYDPSYDEKGRIEGAALDLLDAIARSA